MTEPAAHVSSRGVFEADLHLTTADYREGLLRLPLLWAFYGLAAVILLAALTLTYLDSGSTADEYLVATAWLPLIGLSLVIGWIPDLFAWRMARTSPLRHGATIRIDDEQIACTSQEAWVSYGWPLVRRAVETRSRFHLVVGKGMSTAVCILPKQLFPLEDHEAIRELIRDKVGSLRQH
ncbi:YcxB family protein [Promicromonospora sp. NPDC050249]|uniref:YcxB family protein n=1 Tax=Promicromonospora sp. NPDC050249 TaxID=3154743 RepID=UPI0033E497CE